MISFSVGHNAKNVRQDVLTVQTLLKVKGFEPGPVDGICGPGTIKAIRQFQSAFLANPDGLVEPNRKTWLELTSTKPLSASTRLVQWSGDSAKWPQEKKLQSMTAALQPKVTAVLDTLKKRGFSPAIFFGWRSVAVQLQLYRDGRSKVKFSFHNAQRRDGTPNSYAADIIDSRYGWSAQAELSGFWAALGEEAVKQGLYWGGDWPAFRDRAHVQLLPNSQLAKVKRESGL